MVKFHQLADFHESRYKKDMKLLTKKLEDFKFKPKPKYDEVIERQKAVALVKERLNAEAERGPTKKCEDWTFVRDCLYKNSVNWDIQTVHCIILLFYFKHLCLILDHLLKLSELKI